MNERRVRFISWSVACASALLLLGCSRDGEVARLERTQDAGLRTTSASGAVSLDRATQSLSRVQCDREQRCENVGVDRKWSTLDDCRRDLIEKARSDMNSESCPGGVAQKELDECLADIQKESCSNPLDALGRLVACRTGELCQSAP